MHFFKIHTQLLKFIFKAWKTSLLTVVGMQLSGYVTETPSDTSTEYPWACLPDMLKET